MNLVEVNKDFLEFVVWWVKIEKEGEIIVNCFKIWRLWERIFFDKEMFNLVFVL